nr:hypothetical protein GCM10017745_41030 [Saccharothrix mutabilis subsp. capreolus]
MWEPTIVPRSLDVELPRLRLVDRLAGRWERPVTVVVAGAGFGKTTVVAQAVRAHLLEPRGVDVWVECAPVHESAEALAGALLQALQGVGAARGARGVVDAVVRMAPLDVCLVLDDVHEIPSGSPGAGLLAELVRNLPATAHLVLCGRELPELPLARREAAGEVLRVGAEELSFTETEVRALARGLGRDPAPAGAVRGWPALVRLAFAAGPAAPWRYAREEIIARLPEDQRAALVALAALHTATDDEVAAVTGEPVALADLARRVPLVGVLEDGRYRAHELWAEALAAETRPLHRRAAEVLTARGDLARAGALARRGGDWELLAELAVVLVNTTLSALPDVTARRWLERVPDDVRDEPAFLLLRAAVLHAGDFADPRIDPLLDRAWQRLKHTAVLGQAVITAHSRADLPRLAELARRAGELRGAPTAIALVLRHSVAATVAEVGGDPEAALAEIERAPVVDVPRPVALATVRFHYHCLNMCGRAGEAADLADSALADADEQHLRLNGPVARWFDGDPADLALLRGAPLDGTARDSFVSAAFQAVIAACCGDAGTGARCRAATRRVTTTRATPCWPAPRGPPSRSAAGTRRWRAGRSPSTSRGGRWRTGSTNGTCGGSWPWGTCSATGCARCGTGPSWDPRTPRPVRRPARWCWPGPATSARPPGCRSNTRCASCRCRGRSSWRPAWPPSATSGWAGGSRTSSGRSCTGGCGRPRRAGERCGCSPPCPRHRPPGPAWTCSAPCA